MKQSVDAMFVENAAAPFVKRQVLSEAVYDYILDSIANGTLRSGQKVNSESLSRQLGISRTPIREALRGLEQMGLIESIPFSGCFVSKPSIEEIQEIYRIRSLIEPFALEQAVSCYTDDDFQRLYSLQTEIDKALDAPDCTPKMIFQMNQDFHMLLFSFSGMPKLCGIIEQLWYWLSFYRLILAGQPDYPSQLRREHHSYLDILKHRDSEKLCNLCRDALSIHLEQMPDIVNSYYQSI